MEAEIVLFSDIRPGIGPGIRPGIRHRGRRVYFDRRELSQLLAVYSERVSRGEWRDYAIDHTAGTAMFSVFRHSHGRPVYAIAKTAGPRGPEYAVFDGRRRLARTPTLGEALAVFDQRLRLVED